jgi:Ca2+-binding RTX toxin-like protein
VRYVEGATDLLACGATKEIELVGEGGSDTIDLSALQPADFPQLTEVFINPGHFGDPDMVTGSFFGDTIDAEPGDEIHGLGGDDAIVGGGPIFAGDGNDTVTSAQGNTDLGPGDDRLVDPASGPWTGGPGQDTLAYDFSPAPPTVDIHFSVTDTVFHLDAPTVPPTVADFPSTQFESYDVTLLQGGLQTFSSAGFSGSVDVRGLEGVDKIVAGPGGDFLDGGGGNDEITGGGGLDFVRGGAGNDQVFVRDGVVDGVDCGTGTDIVVADALDLLTGCETVQLPPVTPTPPTPPPTPPVVPATGAVKGPKSVVQGVKAKFTFTSSTAGATFQCKVDKKAWKACTSPYKVATKNLKASKDGTKHVVRVRAVLAGIVDATPSKKTFKVLKS